jgi:hypothetical protein
VEVPRVLKDGRLEQVKRKPVRRRCERCRPQWDPSYTGLVPSKPEQAGPREVEAEMRPEDYEIENPVVREFFSRAKALGQAKGLALGRAEGRAEGYTEGWRAGLAYGLLAIAAEPVGIGELHEVESLAARSHEASSWNHSRRALALEITAGARHRCWLVRAGSPCR